MHFKSCDTQLIRNEDCFPDAKAIKQEYMFLWFISENLEVFFVNRFYHHICLIEVN